MKFWNYISEFFMFRWLFGTHGHSENKHDTDYSSLHTSNADNYIHNEEEYQSYEELLDEQEDYDMMDDSDDFNSHIYGEESYYHDDESYQSYDDFLEEQEDYDMMDIF